MWAEINSAFEKFMVDRDNEEQRVEDEEPEEGADAASELETFKAKYNSAYVTYCECLGRLIQLSEDFQSQTVSKDPSVSPPNPPQSPRSSVSHDHSSIYSFNLPPCDIEVFNGDYMSWPTFRDMFTAVYIKNSALSPVERLFHLNQKTSGEARDIVRRSPLTNEGFQLAWKNLSDRFENKRILINGQLKVLFNLTSIESESASAIKSLQRDINSCISALSLYNMDVKSWDPIFVFLCSNRLPDSTLTLWEQGLADKTVIPKWADLDSFLTNRYRTLESVSEMRNHSRSDYYKPKSSSCSKSSRLSSFHTNVTAPKCPLCTNSIHVIRKCPRFIAMDVQQRVAEIKKQGRCLNCFSKTHHITNCSSTNNCFECQRRHNTMLHDPSSGSYSPSMPASSTYLSPNSIPFSPNLVQSTSSGGGVIQTCFTSNSGGVLLGTALVNVFHLGVEYQARILLDSGSQGTFISERFFNKLKLPYERTNVQISGLNNSIAASVRKICSLVLCSRFDYSVQLSVQAFVVPHLSGNLPAHTLPSSLFSRIPQITLADPHFFQSSNIDILIGGDFLPSIMRAGVMRNICDTLMCQETIFGWILTGPIPNSSPPSTLISNFCEVTFGREICRFTEVENIFLLQRGMKMIGTLCVFLSSKGFQKR
ncbi:uncharacterized protein [Musca autumnalis]|uniref:uncharacterized protein n=1 Tax=Musca autumnalis TaxID=221902 RepID=UPI003CF4455E